MSIVLLNNQKSFQTLSDADNVFVYGNGEETFKKVLKLKDFNETDQDVWKDFLSTLGINPEEIDNIGQVSYEDYAFKYFSFPALCKKKDGILLLVVGFDSKDNSSTKIPLVIDTKKRKIQLVNGEKNVDVFFDKAEYASQKNPNQKISYPVLVIPSEFSERIYWIRVMVEQKPEDQDKIDPKKEYFDYSKFQIATTKYDSETITKYIVDQYQNTGVATSISYLFEPFFTNNTFPPKGICVPITNIATETSGEYGNSLLCTIDLERSWIVGEKGVVLQEFETNTGSKTKGFTLVKSTEITGIWINDKQDGYSEIKSYLAKGSKPSESNPFILWIKAKGKQVNTVPVHTVFSSIPPIPVIKNSTPIGLFAPGTGVKKDDIPF